MSIALLGTTIRRPLIILIAACCVVFAAAFAQDLPQYNVSSLDSLGGTVSRGNSINNRGWVAGYSNLPGNTSRHAALWRNGATGSVEDLRTFGGPNSNVTWNVKNDRGIIVGIAQKRPHRSRWGSGGVASLFILGLTISVLSILGSFRKKGR